MALMAQLFSQVQDIVTVASFAGGLILYAPCLGCGNLNKAIGKRDPDSAIISPDRCRLA
jgi:hypothetical protein